MKAGSEPTILVDTRERLPLCFGAQPIRVTTLRTGDYSVEGLADVVSIERKSLADLFGCIGQSRKRFERELGRLAALKYGAIVIETSLGSVLAGPNYSQVHPNAAFGSLMAWSVRWRLPVFFCDSRELAAMTVMKLLEKCAKYYAPTEVLGKMEFKEWPEWARIGENLHNGDTVTITTAGEEIENQWNPDQPRVMIGIAAPAGALKLAINPKNLNALVREFGVNGEEWVGKQARVALVPAKNGRNRTTLVPVDAASSQTAPGPRAVKKLG